MRVMLVENRFVLSAYYEVFKAFPAYDSVSVLIFNRAYMQKNNGFKHYNILPKAKREKTRIDQRKGLDFEKIFEFIMATDRNIRYFKGNSDHYYETYLKIHAAIVDFKPEVIVGERTTFYELICSYIAKEMNIPYVSPQGARYPIGQTAFIQNCINLPYVLNSDSVFKNRDIFTQKLRVSQAQPAYMKKRPFLTTVAYKFRSLFYAIKSRFYGEIYCTPSILRKISLDFQVQNKLRLWRKFASVPDGKYLTFALQLQPEANLDVDAARFSNQFDTARQLLKICRSCGLELYIKCNPKAKYELLDFDLSELYASGVRFLPLRSKIFTNHRNPEVLVSSTGTALIEAIFHGVFPLSLGGGAFFSYLGIPVADDFDAALSIIKFRDHVCIPKSDDILNQLQSFCIDCDYPDPSVYFDYYLDNSKKMAENWRLVLQKIVEENNVQ